ncbi:MAG TPA: N-acetylglucosamine-6-phosphate deacetylase [Lacipirellulaceae bacterium]|nr:N-acetylglucosamine-6-phosphate deacetylase [Lacipirellulaceae bacterium]
MHAPNGYIDLQVNGYAEVDFNADRLEAEQVAAVCRRLRQDGIAGILATIITADFEAMCRRMANIVRLRDEDRAIADLIWGIHMEGPFLNEQPGYIGAHPAEFARPAERDIAKRLMDAAGGLLRVVTLAPERDAGRQVTRMLVDSGVRVAAGHCNPTLDELRASIDAGLSMFTHLGNGCPALLPRHDNIIQRVLSLSDRLVVSFIADGVHVPFVALRNYLKCCGIERALIVTDAICGAGLGPGEYSLGDRRVVVDENLATWAADRSHLVGSAGTMQRSAENLRTKLGLDDQQIKLLMIDNPRRVLEEEGGR